MCMCMYVCNVPVPVPVRVRVRVRGRGWVGGCVSVPMYVCRGVRVPVGKWVGRYV